MRRILLSVIILTLFASPSLASVCTRLQADLEAVESAREQANVGFEVAQLAYEQAQNCHPLYWVKLATTKAGDAAETAMGVAVAAAALAAYPLWLAWPFLAF